MNPPETKPAPNSAQSDSAYALGFRDGQQDRKAGRYHDQSPHHDLRDPLRHDWRRGYNAGYDAN